MRIELTPRAEHQLRKLKLNQSLLRRLSASFDQITANPQAGKPLGGELEGLRSYRLGNWRILYEISVKDALILIHSIADRKDVHR